ncbi:MAG: hypothetical protein ACFFCQ_12085 [Promethearchaeota archaeon]
MKSKIFLVLSGLLIVSIPVISPVSAQSIIFRANGTLDEYNPTLPPVFLIDTIILGSWSIKINENYNVNFKAQFLEENGLENPGDMPGTLDKFRINLIDGIVINIDDSTSEVKGTLIFDKSSWDINTGKPKFRTIVFENTGIVIDSSGIRIYLPIVPGMWIIGGSTLSI